MPDGHDSLLVNGWWRVGCGLLGLAGLGSGGAAVYVTHLEAGPVALLVIGTLLVLVAVVGHLPWRIRIGDNEVQWGAEKTQVATIVQDLVKDVGPDTPAAKQAVARLEATAPDLGFAIQRGVAYATSCRSLCTGTSPPLGVG